MKNILLVLVFTGFFSFGYSQTYCEPIVKEWADSYADSGAEWLKDFQVHLDPIRGDSIPKAKYSFVLSKERIYQFTIASSKNYPGRGVFELWDDKTLIGTNYSKEQDKVFTSYKFKNQKTGVYHFVMYFIDGEEGCAVGELFFIEELNSIN